MGDPALRLDEREDTLLRLRDVLARVPISRTAWYRLVANGEAPAPIHLGRSALWRASEIATWIASLAATK